MRTRLVVAERRIPREIRSNLCILSLLLPHHLNLMQTYIYGKLPTHPHQLRRIRLQLPHTTDVRLERINSIFAKLVDDFQVPRKRVWVLVVLGGDVGFDGGGEEHGLGSAEGDLVEVPALHRFLTSSNGCGETLLEAEGREWWEWLVGVEPM